VACIDKDQAPSQCASMLVGGGAECIVVAVGTTYPRTPLTHLQALCADQGLEECGGQSADQLLQLWQHLIQHTLTAAGAKHRGGGRGDDSSNRNSSEG
jgi:hypothetical protein